MRNAHLHPLITAVLESSLKAQHLTAECIRRVESLQQRSEPETPEVKPMKSEVTITRTIEVDVEITCRVTPGTPARGPSYASGGEPADPGEVEILSMRSERGANLDSLIDELSKADVEGIEEQAMEVAGDAAEAAWEAAEEARADAQRERALCGDDF